MGKIGTGAVFYTIGKAMSRLTVLSTGASATAFGMGIAPVLVDPLNPDQIVFTAAAIERALQASGKRTALAVVGVAGLQAFLPSTIGKGCDTIANLIRKRNTNDPAYAETVIDAMTNLYLASLEEDLAA